VKSQMWSLLSIESTYLGCHVISTYAVRSRTKVLRGDSRPAAQPRSLEGTVLPWNMFIYTRCLFFFSLDSYPEWTQTWSI